jgi:hypothetical protein
MSTYRAVTVAQTTQTVTCGPLPPIVVPTVVFPAA